MGVDLGVGAGAGVGSGFGVAMQLDAEVDLNLELQLAAVHTLLVEEVDAVMAVMLAACVVQQALLA